MAKRVRSVIHIKNRTAGSSNELSFDVLEAKKNDADAASGRAKQKIVDKVGNKKQARKANRQAKGSKNDSKSPNTLPRLYTEDAGQASKNITMASLPYEDPTAEIVRRKKKRTRHRVLAIAVVACVLIGGGYVVVSEVNRYMSDQDAARSLLNSSLSEIEKADEAIVAMDELLENPLAEQDEDKIADVSKQIDDAENHLDTAYAQAKDASEKLVGQHDRETAEQAMQSISARQEMAKQGKMLFDLQIKVKSAAQHMNDAWNLILEADALTVEASKLVEDTTDENVEASIEKSERAIEKFEGAQRLVQEASLSLSSDTLSSYDDYLSKRIAGQRAALDSDAAILLMDRGHAEEYNAVLFDYDTQAAQIAQDFPNDPTQLVMDYYMSNSQSAKDKYLQARSQAATADAYIRDYLGEPNK